MPKSNQLLVFAYGSNMRLSRIQQRVASAVPLTTGCVTGYQLAMHKRSQDGSAKADAFFTGRDSDRIWGVVYAIDETDKAVLDEHEFLGTGYLEVLVRVCCPDQNCLAWMYVARSQALDATLLPYSWYHHFLIEGATEHRLPLCYIQQLREFRCCIDPDSERSRRNFELCDRGPSVQS